MYEARDVEDVVPYKRIHTTTRRGELCSPARSTEIIFKKRETTGLPYGEIFLFYARDVEDVVPYGIEWCEHSFPNKIETRRDVGSDGFLP